MPEPNQPLAWHTGTFYQGPPATGDSTYFDIETHRWQGRFVTEVFVTEYVGGRQARCGRVDQTYSDTLEDAANVHRHWLKEGADTGTGYWRELRDALTRPTAERPDPEHPVHSEDRARDQPKGDVEDRQLDAATRTESLEPQTELPEPPPRDEVPDGDGPGAGGDPANSDRIVEGGALEQAAQQAEGQIGQFFDNGQRAAGVLKNQLDDYVLEGGSPILGALGATGLDAMSLAMEVARGIPLSLLDTRRLGEGVAKGTWEGVREDAGRVLNVLPAGRVARALSIAVTVGDVVDAANKGDAKGLAFAGASAAIAVLAKKLHAKNSKSVTMDAHGPGWSKRPVRVPKKEIKEWASRSDKIFSTMEPSEKKYKTLASFLVYDPVKKEFYRALSQSDELVERKYRDQLRKGEEALRGIGRVPGGDNINHAEVNGITSIWSNGHEVVAMTASNNPCTKNLHNCDAMIDDSGLVNLTSKQLSKLVESLLSK